MADTNIHITTFNAGRALIDIDYFASSLHTSFTAKGRLPPDLIVLCLQEIAPLGYCFLGGSLLAPYFSCFDNAVRKAISWNFQGIDYAHVVTRNVGFTGIVVFSRTDVKERIRWIEEAGTGVGWWDMGNKGAVGVRLGLETETGDIVPLTFVAAHLAPMEEAWERRNEDWRSICATLVFEPVQGQSQVDGESQPLLSASADAANGQPRSMFQPPSHVFFAGDLNYRTSDSAPSSSDFSSWPQPMSSSSDPSHFSNLLAKDQLAREMSAARTLHRFSEAPISFPPTYKYSSRAQKLAGESANALKHDENNAADADGGPALNISTVKEQVWLWAKHRIPSWCDRILFLSAAPPSTIHTYTALPVQPTSDHRPVVLSFTIPQKPLAESQPAPFAIAKGWRERRAAARRLEFVVGLGAYLGLTGQGEALLAGTLVGVVAGYFVLQWLLVVS